jgi:antagonist of KipI
MAGKGDVLNIGPTTAEFRKKEISAKSLHYLSPRKIFRVTAGPQCDWFSESAQQLFYSNIYRVSEQSDRMGLRLEGTAIPSHSGEPMITEGVSLGAIHVPPGGQPIILFVELQTTGGYPKIANVISADLSSIGQLRPRDEIRFEPVDWETARTLGKGQEEMLASKDLVLE